MSLGKLLCITIAVIAIIINLSITVVVYNASDDHGKQHFCSAYHDYALYISKSLMYRTEQETRLVGRKSVVRWSLVVQDDSITGTVRPI